MHDFQYVAVAQFDLRQRRTRRDFAIAFHRHLLRVQLKSGDEIGNGAAGDDTARRAIDGEGDFRGHGFSPLEARAPHRNG